jgi:hypothetical protein
MALRWAAAGMLAAEAQFRLVKGHRELPSSGLTKPLTSAILGVLPGDRAGVAAGILNAAREPPPCWASPSSARSSPPRQTTCFRHDATHPGVPGRLRHRPARRRRADAGRRRRDPARPRPRPPIHRRAAPRHRCRPSRPAEPGSTTTQTHKTDPLDLAPIPRGAWDEPVRSEPARRSGPTADPRDAFDLGGGSPSGLPSSSLDGSWTLPGMPPTRSSRLRRTSCRPTPWCERHGAPAGRSAGAVLRRCQEPWRRGGAGRVGGLRRCRRLAFFWEHSQLRDPDLPHLLLLVANLVMLGGIVGVWIAPRLQRTQSKDAWPGLLGLSWRA